MTWLSIVSFGEMSKHPIAYLGSIAVGLCALLGFLLLGAVYLRMRKKLSVKGIVIDVLTSTVYLSALSSFCLFLSAYLDRITAF